MQLLSTSQSVSHDVQFKFISDAAIIHVVSKRVTSGTEHSVQHTLTGDEHRIHCLVLPAFGHRQLLVAVQQGN